MSSHVPDNHETGVSLRPVDRDNWRDVVNLKVSEAQCEFVAEPCYYLALCSYGKEWQPLAIYQDDRVIGFMMWATDPADGSCWLGGILIDQGMQRHGYGRQALKRALTMLKETYGYRRFALSYQPANLVAKRLYKELGFVETDEWEGDEIVARLALPE